MKLQDATNVRPGQKVKVVGPGFAIVGRLQYVEVDLNEEYVEDRVLSGESTKYLPRSNPTVRMMVGRWDSPHLGLYDDEINVEVVG